MPQKPIMPSPYMTAVDAMEDIVFSCSIDSRDTIVDYQFNFEKISTNDNKDLSDSNTQLNIPPIFVESIACPDYWKSKISLYKESEESEFYTMVVSPTDNIGYSNKSEFVIKLSSGLVIGRELIREIIYVADGTVPGYYLQNFTNATNITLLGDVKWIDEYAFKNCCSLKEIFLPDTLGKSSVETTAFSGTNSLTSISIPHDSIFRGRGILTNVLNVKEVVVRKNSPNNKEDKFVGVRKNAFKNCNKLERVVFLYDVEKIDMYAFWGCSNLKRIEGIESLIELGNGAFCGCRELSFPINELSKIEKIGDYAFASSGVQELYINSNLTNMGGAVFEGSALSKIIISSLNENIEIDPRSSWKTFASIDNSITIYYKEMSVSLLNFVSKIQNVNHATSMASYYELSRCTPVPIYGGNTDASILSYRLPQGTLRNDEEYCWSVTLVDSFGKTITSPSYYFKTRSTQKIKIQPNAKKATETVTNDNDNYLQVTNNICNDYPIFVDIDIDIDSSSGILHDETTEKLMVRADGNRVYQSVSDKSSYTTMNNNGLNGSFFTLYHTPTYEISSSGSRIYNIRAYLPSPKIVTTESTIDEDYYTVIFANNNLEDVYYIHKDEAILSEYLPFTSAENENFKGWTETYGGSTADYKSDDLTSNTIGALFPDKRVVVLYPVGITVFSWQDIELEEAGVVGNGTEVGYYKITDEEYTLPDGNYDVIYDYTFNSVKYTVAYYYLSDIDSYTYTFKANIEKNQSESIIVPIKYHRWHIYEIQNQNDIMIEDSGEIYGSNISYTYSKLLPGKEYRIEVFVENNDGVIISDTYDVKTKEADTELEFDLPIPLADANNNAILIDLGQYSSSYTFSIIRKDLKSNAQKMIVDGKTGGCQIYDYTACSNREYIYVLYVLDRNNVLSSYELPTIIPVWDKISVIGFNGARTENNIVELSKEDIWLFELNVAEIEYAQTLSKNIQSSIGSKYALSIAGKTNYKSFNLQCLIGGVENCGYLRDDYSIIEKWDSFVASPLAKLVIDDKGHSSICDAVESKYNSNRNIQEQPTTINTSFVEIGSCDDVSLVVIERRD